MSSLLFSDVQSREMSHGLHDDNEEGHGRLCLSGYINLKRLMKSHLLMCSSEGAGVGRRHLGESCADGLRKRSIGLGAESVDD